MASYWRAQKRDTHCRLYGERSENGPIFLSIDWIEIKKSNLFETIMATR